MNSVYGFTGAANGMLPLVAIASTVTAQGRFMIQQSKEYVEAHFEGAQVRYGDTDSIMVEFDVGDRTGIDAIEYSWSLGERAAKEITKLFKPPNNLELEKVYCPYFLYSKKRYAAKMWVKGATEMEMEKIDIKGLQVVRRDTCEFVRDVCQEVININMNSGNSREYIELKKAELLSGNVPMDKLILSKRLGDSYKSTNLAHIRVRDKIKERAPGSEPRSGDRVQFVIVKTTGKGARMYEKAEDPTWVTANNLELDYAYYYKHQFEKPVNDLNI
jgi:DNA polymerase delta subunit 1